MALHSSVPDAALKPLALRRICDTLPLWCDGKLEDGCLVEKGNIVVCAGGDKGLNSPWIPRIEIELVHLEEQYDGGN